MKANNKCTQVKKRKRKDKINLRCVVQYDTIENAMPFHSSPLSNIKLTSIEKIRNLKKEGQAGQERQKNFEKRKTFISRVQETAEFKSKGKGLERLY